MEIQRVSGCKSCIIVSKAILLGRDGLDGLEVLTLSSLLPSGRRLPNSVRFIFSRLCHTWHFKKRDFTPRRSCSPLISTGQIGGRFALHCGPPQNRRFAFSLVILSQSAAAITAGEDQIT